MEAIEDTELEGLTPDSFFTHYWNSKAVEDPTDSIETSRVRRSVAEARSGETSLAEQANARAFIVDFRFSTKILAALGETLQSGGQAKSWHEFPNYREDKFEKICAPLYGILVTRSLQPLPLLLALFTKYFNNTRVLSTKNLIGFSAGN